MMQFSSEKTKYTTKFTSRMKKDFEKIRRRGYDIAEFARVVQKLANAEPLEERYRDHALEGKWMHHRELHIRPDWLLIYQIKDDVLILELSRTGTHSDLFKK